MISEETIFGLITIAVFIFIFYYVAWRLAEPSKCSDGKEHDWKFDCNSKGRTGDLGFGIRGSWDIDYYRCSKCRKEKEVENY